MRWFGAPPPSRWCAAMVVASIELPPGVGTVSREANPPDPGFREVSASRSRAPGINLVVLSVIFFFREA